MKNKENYLEKIWGGGIWRRMGRPVPGDPGTLCRAPDGVPGYTAAGGIGGIRL